MERFPFSQPDEERDPRHRADGPEQDPSLQAVEARVAGAIADALARHRMIGRDGALGIAELLLAYHPDRDLPEIRTYMDRRYPKRPHPKRVPRAIQQPQGVRRRKGAHRLARHGDHRRRDAVQ